MLLTGQGLEFGYPYSGFFFTLPQKGILFFLMSQESGCMRLVASASLKFNNLSAPLLNRQFGSKHRILGVDSIEGCIQLAARDICETIDQDSSDLIDIGFDFQLVFFSRRLKLALGHGFSSTPIFFGYLCHRDKLAQGSGMTLRDRGPLTVTSQSIDDILIESPLEAHRMLKRFLVGFPC